MNREVIAVICLAVAGASASAQEGGRARIDFLLHCSGCHGQDGVGNPEKGIPNLVGQIGHFQRLPEGREFVVQVPGMLSAGLPDDRAAAVATYMTRRYAGDSLPENFAPYTAEEARKARESRPADIMAKRRSIYEKLLTMGFVVK